MRIKGNGNQTIEIRDGKVYVDGVETADQPEPKDGPTIITGAQGPVHVGKGDQINY